MKFKLFRHTCEKRVTGRVTRKQPLGTMLTVYRTFMTKCVTSPPLLGCTVDGHTLRYFGKLEIKNLPHFLTYFFIKKFTGHACEICRSNCEILPVDRHLFRGLYTTKLIKMSNV
jgi:hypothetical protein